jgi:hypothetical protein
VTVVQLTATAVGHLEELVATHSLPGDTRARLRRSLAILSDFPSVGARLPEPNDQLRFLLGPWRWLLVVYRYDEATDTVVVLGLEDVRSNAASTRVLG